MLCGSHNYNLNTPESDKDYKVFVAPTFDDLYFNNQFSKSYIGETEDFDVHDIRKISSLFWKANVNFLEVLFSEDIQIKVNVKSETAILLNSIFAMKNDIARMNLPYLYDACMGMYVNKLKSINKGTEGTKYLVEAFGYDTKMAMHSIRILDFLRRFAENGFTDFKKAIWYADDDFSKQYLLNIKNGKLSKEEYYKMAKYEFDTVEICHKKDYKSQEADVYTNNTLLDIVKEIVKLKIN